jgi:transcriptional regulator with XRE-family HTH domain
MNTIAAQIREARQAQGLSQELLARRADCSFNSVRVYERGLVPTRRSEVLPRILEVLGLNADRAPDA